MIIHMQLSYNESVAIGNIFNSLTKQEGEDVIGVLMKYGCFKQLPDKELVRLSKKIDGCIETFEMEMRSFKYN